MSRQANLKSRLSITQKSFQAIKQESDDSGVNEDGRFHRPTKSVWNLVERPLTTLRPHAQAS